MEAASMTGLHILHLAYGCQVNKNGIYSLHLNTLIFTSIILIKKGGLRGEEYKNDSSI